MEQEGVVKKDVPRTEEQQWDKLFLSPSRDDLKKMGVDELRCIRNECMEAEVAISYTRRVAQGRLDLLKAWLEVEDTNPQSEQNDLTVLTDKLSTILAAHPRPSGIGHLPVFLSPGQNATEWIEKVEQVVNSQNMILLDSLEHSEIESMLSSLKDLERELSHKRRLLHKHIDSIQAELVRRYQSGEIKVDEHLQ
ncbi:MAG: hypothetical protein M1483_02550 [Actinobacteria bacterium]|nr:hypothetical protein [Actinomycetota bacterium]MCL6104505.1 hypothetical protein [Actinomycetota bacterium]